MIEVDTAGEAVVVELDDIDYSGDDEDYWDWDDICSCGMSIHECDYARALNAGGEGL